MRNFFVLFITLLFIGCASPVLTKPDAVDPTPTPQPTPAPEASGYAQADYTIKLVGGKIQVVGGFTTVTSVKSISRSLISDIGTVQAAGRIPSIGLVAQTSNGYFVTTDNVNFTKITLPGTTLHLHQFQVHNGYVYYGVDHMLYRKLSTSFGADFTTGEVVVNDTTKPIFSTGNEKTNAQYIVFANGTIRYIYSNGSSYSMDSITGTLGSSLSLLHFAYFYFDTNGDLRSVGSNTVVDLNNIPRVDMKGAFVKYYGQEQWMNGVLVANRNDHGNSNFISNGSKTTGFARDTMFRSYRDTQVYFESDSTRAYVSFDFSGSDILVSGFITTTTGVTKKTEFNVGYESVDGHAKLVPNMWTDVDGSVLVALGNTLTRYNGFGASLTTTSVSTMANRIDAFTVLPNGGIILMDKNGAWFNTDGTSYTGDNIVAQH